MSDNPATSTAYRSLDAWRGLASLAVVAFHTAAITTGRFAGLAAMPIYAAFSYGYLGVQVFFVISGYCISSSAASILRRDAGVLSYLKDRVRRIYPACWFSLLFFALFSIVAGVLVESGHMASSNLADRNVLDKGFTYVFAQLTLTQLVLHQGFLSIVCWTLCYEVAFYLILGVFLLPLFAKSGERVMWNGLHAVTLGCLCLLIFRPEHRFYPMDLWPQFGMGVLAYDVLKHTTSAAPKRWLAAISLASLVFIGARDLPMGTLGQPSRLTFLVALAFTFVVIGLYRHDAVLTRLHPVRLLAAVGAFSYSLYLIHFLTIGIVGQALKLLHLGAGAHLVYSAASIAVATVAGWAFYRAFELPFMKRPKTHSVRPSETVLGQPVVPAAASDW